MNNATMYCLCLHNRVLPIIKRLGYVPVGLGNDNYSEHSYYYYRATSAVDFRSKNIESFDSLEKNSIDLYATVKSLYIQERNKKIANSESIVETQDFDDWEEIDTN